MGLGERQEVNFGLKTIGVVFLLAAMGLSWWQDHRVLSQKLALADARHEKAMEALAQANVDLKNGTLSNQVKFYRACTEVLFSAHKSQDEKLVRKLEGVKKWGFFDVETHARLVDKDNFGYIFNVGPKAFPPLPNYTVIVIQQNGGESVDWLIKEGADYVYTAEFEEANDGTIEIVVTREPAPFKGSETICETYKLTPRGLQLTP